MGANVVRWLPQSSKLLYTVKNGVGGFDSHPLSPITLGLKDI